MTKASALLMRQQTDEARNNVGITTLISVGISQYDYLKRLNGPSIDLINIKNIFIENPKTAIYPPNQFIELRDATSNDLRSSLLTFLDGRHSRGDIVIFYFSGHGAVLSGGEFVLCTRDSRINGNLEGGGILSVSGVLFKDLVLSFSSVGIRPIFIIDACFSGTAALSENYQIGKMVQNQSYMLGNLYALLCSSSPELEAKDTPEGGIFTIRLNEVIQEGLGSKEYRNNPVLFLHDISMSLSEKLTKDGYPIPRLFIGPQLPSIALSKNTAFRPESESFPPSYAKIINLLWNNGNPKEMTIDELGNELGRGVYSNHSKLSLEPWNLVEDGETRSHRRLTERGILFASGKIAIPKRIIKSPDNWEWISDPDSYEIYISDM